MASALYSWGWWVGHVGFEALICSNASIMIPLLELCEYSFLTHLSSKATCFGFLSKCDSSHKEGTRHNTKQLIEVIGRSLHI